MRFEMFLEKETVEAMLTGKVPWYDDRDDKKGYKCDGLDPKIFPSRRNMKPEVPLKLWSGDHRIALKWFARAKRTGVVSLPPTHLLMASMPVESFLRHIFCGDIVIHSETETCGFTKPVDLANYSGLELDLIEFSDPQAKGMLDAAEQYLM